jgi:small glutamine-rich tetratricopeptide repeat-containing protein alpha
VQCLSESFNVDPESEADREKYSIKPASLLSILDVYLKTKSKSTAATAAAQTPSPAAPSTSSSVDKAGAEKLKAEGNALMSQKLYDSAIQKYTEAIAKDPSNAVYLSNRAAAWGGVGQHEKAVEDAQKALEVDPTFSKAFSRLG